MQGRTHRHRHRFAGSRDRLGFAGRTLADDTRCDIAPVARVVATPDVSHLCRHDVYMEILPALCLAAIQSCRPPCRCLGQRRIDDAAAIAPVRL
mmetsp:Transcript_91171/g.263026  ORF Transcript_91171/g.263026 Transcript_91171/m.263026 type:complete len:94 (-) Transcript_91171:1845-2126(-)